MNQKSLARGYLSDLFEEYKVLISNRSHSTSLAQESTLSVNGNSMKRQNSFVDSLMDFGDTGEEMQPQRMEKDELVRYLDDVEGEACGMDGELVLQWWKVCL